MRISLNLATRPYTDLRPAIKRLRISMAVLLVVGIGLLLGVRALHQKAEEARATEQLVQSKIDAIQRERQGYQERMRQPANAQLLTQAAALNQLFEEKTFSWTLAMEDLETVLPGGVQVTTLEPQRDTKTSRIILKLRVVGPRDHADDLVQNLEHSRHFLQPHIMGESSETTGGPNERLEPVSASNRFTYELQAEYNPVAPAIRKTEKMQTGDKPTAETVQLNQSSPLPHAIRPLPINAAQPVLLPHAGSRREKRSPNPGGTR
jgi:type IV pilus assembly protein PilN